jgi:hypothetical protein
MQTDQHLILVLYCRRHYLAHWHACHRAVLDRYWKHLQQLIAMRGLRNIQSGAPLLNRLRGIRIRRQRTAQPSLRLGTEPLRQRHHALHPRRAVGLRNRTVRGNLRRRILHAQQLLIPSTT